MNYLKSIVCCCGLFLLNSCLHHQSKFDGHVPEALPESVIEQLSYPSTVPQVTHEVGDDNKHYRIHLFEFVTAKIIHPDKKNRNLIQFELYETKKPLEQKPALILHPISGGSYILARYFARHFSEAGWNCILVKRYKLSRKVIHPDTINPVIRQTIINHKQVLDWLDNSAWKTDFIADLGVSKGALQSAMLTATDKRIDASVFMLGGGDLPYVLAHSNEPGVTRRRNQYMQDANIDREAFHHHMIHALGFDPLKYARYIDARKTMHVLARFDLAVPYRCGQLLYEAMPGAQKYTLLAGHYTALVFLPFITSETEDFLHSKYKHFLRISRTKAISKLKQ